MLAQQFELIAFVFGQVYEATTCIVTQAVGKKVGVDLCDTYLRMPVPMTQAQDLWDTRVRRKPET